MILLISQHSCPVVSPFSLLQPLMSSLNVASGYTAAKYGRTIKVAITESNYAILNASDEKDYTYHFNYRTFPLILSTFALMKNPDLVLSRQIFDYRVSLTLYILVINELINYSGPPQCRHPSE